jgi:integrase
MPRQIHRLSATEVEKAKSTGKTYMLADGGGLWLRISKSGAKSWIFRYMLDGKSREMGLGSLQSVGLKKARTKAGNGREQLDAGIDPIDQKKTETAERRLNAAKSITFDECAEAYIESNKAGWSNDKHSQQWTNTIQTYASPTLGKLAVQDVDTDLVMRCLEPIWATKTETATRIRGRIESILDWATVKGYRIGANPARWRGHLDKLLPKPSKVTEVVHHPALHYDDIPAFIEELGDVKGIAARALEFTVYTATRSSEVLLAEWEEIDLEKKLWIIPKQRMKARKEHRVPLSPRAIKLLKDLDKIRESDYVFPSPRYGKHLSNMAMTKTLRDMGRKDITVHGFRSTFRDWAAEKTNTPNIVAEAALAHVVGNKAEAAYRRGDLFAKRVQLMDSWARYAHSQPADIVSIGEAKTKLK